LQFECKNKQISSRAHGAWYAVRFSVLIHTSLEDIMTQQEFLDALNTKFNGIGYTFLVECPGVKYTRIVQTAAESQSVFCFVDAAGNIYKAASWKAPAKGVRSTLATVDIAKVDPYGTWLYR
jgi:hypothetical protein